MTEEDNVKSIVKEKMPNFLKAAIWGTLTYIVIYYLPLLIYPLEALPMEYFSQIYYIFLAITVFFAVITQFFSGTVLAYTFGVMKSVIIIAYLIYVFNGGIISLTIPIFETVVNLVVDLRAVLIMLISVNLLSLAKNMLQVINLMSEKVETNQLSGF